MPVTPRGVQGYAMRIATRFLRPPRGNDPGLTQQSYMRGADAPCSPPLGGDGALFMPVFAMDATDAQTGRWRIREIERIALPAALVSPARFVVRMKDDALEPQVRRGAYLLIDMSGNHAPPLGEGEGLYAVSWPGRGLLIRQADFEASRSRLALADMRPEKMSLRLNADGPDAHVVGRVVWIIQPL